MKKRIMAMLLTIAMAMTLLPITALAAASSTQFAGGDGTAQNPYQVATVEQLNAVRDELSAHYVLVSDIDLSGDTWIPIGTTNAPFSGSFDGSGHTISHLTSGYFSSENYAGLFGYCDTGYICNVHIKDSAIVLTLSDRGINAGGIVGSLGRDSRVEGCTYDGSIQITITGSYGSSVGGIVGWSQGEITSCTNNSNIVVDGVDGYDDAVGGIVGTSYADIENCKNNGDVSSDDYAGGIIGTYNSRNRVYPIVSSCSNNGEISAKYAGGITAKASGATIDKCANLGRILSNGSASRAAGIVAYTTDTQIRLCENTADVYSNADTSYNAFAAGIVANAIGTTEISQCRNSGEISASTKHTGSWYDTTPAASASGGGIVSTTSDSTEINDCYNTGKIMASASDAGYGGYYSSKGYAYSGGIAGRDSGVITNCYNMGDIYTYDADYCYEGTIAGSTDESIEIKNCYFINNPNVSATGDSKATLLSVSGCTDSHLRQQSTYVNFDFSSVWYFDSTGGYPYPQLRGLADDSQIPDVPPVPGDGSILALSPANGATNVGYDASNPPVFKITFDREIASSADQEFVADVDLTLEDTFAIYRKSDDTMIYKPGVDSHLRFTLTSDKKTLVVTPLNNHTLLNANTEYYVTMGEGFVRFADGTTSSSIGKGDWSFKTKEQTGGKYPFSWAEALSKSPIESADDNLVICITALASLGYSDFKQGDCGNSKLISDFVKANKYKELYDEDYPTDVIWEIDGDPLGSYKEFYCDTVGDYVVYDCFDDNQNSGFYGVCFKSPDGKYIISYRGSQGGMGDAAWNIIIQHKTSSDWATDLDFALRNELSEQFDRALTFYYNIEKKVGRDNIILTGHSLGGALAAYVSICTGTRAYTVDGAVGHILDTAFWESYGAVRGFIGADSFNFVNLTDELGANGLLSDIGLDVGDIIQATKQNLYPMITYKSIHSGDAANLGTTFSLIAGSHHAMSFLTYDEVSKVYSLGNKVKTFDCDSGWSNDIRNYVKILKSFIWGLPGLTAELLFDHGRVQLGSTDKDVIKAPKSTALLGANHFTQNRQFGGNESDKITGYSSADVIVPGKSGNSSEILDGQGGSDIYFIDAECRNSTINDPGGSDTIILRNWIHGNITMQDTGEYVRITDSERILLVNKNRSLFSWGKITVYWTDEINQKQGRISADLFADAQNSRNTIHPYAIQTSASDQVPVRLILIDGITDVAVYDSNRIQISDGSFTNRSGDNTVYTDYAYYYGYNNKEDDNPYAIIYLFNDGYTIEASSNDIVSAALYQYNEAENELTEGSIVQDIALASTKSLAIVSDGADEGYYIVEDDSATKIEEVETVTYVQSISLSQSAITLNEGDSKTLSVKVDPIGAWAEGTWYSSDKNVVSVNENGVVTAHKRGNATITFISLNGKTAECNISVVPKDSTSDNPSSSDSSRPSGGSSSNSSIYSINVPSNITGGTVKVTPTSASEGQRVTLTVTPNSGYELSKLIVTDGKGNELKLTDKDDRTYTFTMPNSKVDVKVEFVRQQTTPSFTDVQPGAYYADAVAWALEKSITAGTSATTFSPDAPCTRAQIVTFLWRAAGSPEATDSCPFTDVPVDSYYYDAVLWAVEQGITSGTSATTFSPNVTCTRAQAVTFLYRYEKSPAVSGSNGFTDVAADAYYSNAVQWAVDKNVTAGTSATTFSPNEACTRGQIVTFLYRDMA